MGAAVDRPEDYDTQATTPKQLQAIDMGYAGPVAHTFSTDRKSFDADATENPALLVSTDPTEAM